MTVTSEICEHGSQKRKCPYCEVLALDAENEKLRIRIEQLERAIRLLKQCVPLGPLYVQGKRLDLGKLVKGE